MRYIKLKAYDQLTQEEYRQSSKVCELYISEAESKLFVTGGYYGSQQVIGDAKKLDRLMIVFTDLAKLLFLSQVTFDNIKKLYRAPVQFTELDLIKLQNDSWPGANTESEAVGYLVDFIFTAVRNETGRQLANSDILKVFDLARSFEHAASFGLFCSGKPYMYFSVKDAQARKTSTSRLLSLIYGQPYFCYSHVNIFTRDEFICYHADSDFHIAETLFSAVSHTATYVLESNNPEGPYAVTSILPEGARFILPKDTVLM